MPMSLSYGTEGCWGWGWEKPVAPRRFLCRDPCTVTDPTQPSDQALLDGGPRQGPQHHTLPKAGPPNLGQSPPRTGSG